MFINLWTAPKGSTFCNQLIQRTIDAGQYGWHRESQRLHYRTTVFEKCSSVPGEKGFFTHWGLTLHLKPLTRHNICTYIYMYITSMDPPVLYSKGSKHMGSQLKPWFGITPTPHLLHRITSPPRSLVCIVLVAVSDMLDVSLALIKSMCNQNPRQTTEEIYGSHSLAASNYFFSIQWLFDWMPQLDDVPLPALR